MRFSWKSARRRSARARLARPCSELQKTSVRVSASLVQDDPEFAEPFECDGLDDGVSVCEVAVENRLAVFNAVSQSASGYGLPPFGLS
jgi:hypothetical protein